ncbi:MAG: cation:proton antiporter [Betaproteobacteria bacterium]|nr:cation:proton antiporter [Betaproteobacteria bacterium]
MAFKLAVAAAAAAAGFSTTDVAVNFLLMSGGGVCAGYVIQWLGRQLRQRLVDIGVDDPVLQTLLTVLIPYAAYLAAEALQVSGILAVVIAGLWTGGKEVRGLSAESRRHAREVWRMISYVFNGLVFVLLGLQLRHMLAAVGHYDAAWLAGLAFGVWALLMALRLSWVWLSAHVRFRLQWGWAGARSGPDGRRMFLVGWAAVRGSVTLATALSVPLLTTAGLPFPQRDLVVFLAAATIVLTLALNGIPLPWLIRKLQPPADDEDAREESAARVALARAGIAAVQSVLAQRADDQGRDFAEQLIHRYEGKITLREVMPPPPR